MWLFSTFVLRPVHVPDRDPRAVVRIRATDWRRGDRGRFDAGWSWDKKRNDLFRHWLIGLGSGDLHVKSGGPANLDFEMNNVLFVGTKNRSDPRHAPREGSVRTGRQCVTGVRWRLRTAPVVQCEPRGRVFEELSMTHDEFRQRYEAHEWEPYHPLAVILTSGNAASISTCRSR